MVKTQNRVLILLFCILIIIPAASCRQQEAQTVKPDLKQISDEAIERIAGKKILFAHMSVGVNILDGIRKIQEQDPRFKRIRIAAFKPGMKTEEAGIYHFLLGNNGFPDKKVKTNQEVLLSGNTGEQFDVAVFKFCYVDFKKNTNVDDVFANYRAMVSSLKDKYQDLNIVHVTAPLTTRYSGLKGWLKFVLGKGPPNEERSLFSEMLFQEYGQSDPIFDLARVESTDNTGKRMSYASDGKTVYYMLDGYTTDGGHLNETGQLLAGLELIKTLSDIDR